MTIYHVYADDVYEITHNGTITPVIRYRQGLNCRGEMVNFDELSLQLQEGILNKLSKNHSDELTE